jgi:hypothetical protein
MYEEAHNALKSAKDEDDVPEGFELGDFAKPDVLFRMMGHGEDVLPPVRLLDGEWLRVRAAKIRAATTVEERRRLALPRRQDLYAAEPEAYISVEHLALLPRGDTKIGTPLPVVVVSHMWRGPDHPDPEGDNLLALVDAFEQQEAQQRFPSEGFAVFIDWCSLPQRNAAGERTAAELEAFARAISKMQLWYAHEQTLVYMLTATPPSWGDDATPYHDRGWPTFERRITMFNKRQSARAWANVVDVGLPKGQRSEAAVPLTEEAFASLLDRKAFTNGADKSFVSKLYNDTLKMAFGMAMTLRYVGMRWGDDEMEQLALVLPQCRQLIRLNFKGAHNRFTAASAKILAQLLNSGAMPSLQVLGAGCTEKTSLDPGPLMSDTDLQAACRKRGISMQRDADAEVKPE